MHEDGVKAGPAPGGRNARSCRRSLPPACVYAEGAFWQQHPFRDPEPGYLARVFAEEESAECRFGAPIVDSDRAAVPWSAQTRLTDSAAEDLARVSLLRFRADGLVVEERDFWNHRSRIPGD